MGKNEVGKPNKATALLAQSNGILETSMNRRFWLNQKGEVNGLPRYDQPEDLVKALSKWEEDTVARIQKGEEIIPDAEGMCAALGISMATLKSWRKGDMGDAFRNIAEVELNRIAAVKNQLALKGAIPPIIWATQMNNVHGYTQAKNVEIEVSQKRTPESAETLINSAKLLP